MAIPNNYDGVIKAVKAKSGSTKPYTQNFKGIIEAIEDWVGGGGGSAPISLCAGGGLDDSLGCIKLDYANVKVTADNVFPEGTTDFTRAVPYYTGPNGEVWKHQSDYNSWLYNEIINFEPGSGGTYFGDTPPATANEGDVFTQSGTYAHYVYNGSTWVQIY